MRCSDRVLFSFAAVLMLAVIMFAFAADVCDDVSASSEDDYSKSIAHRGYSTVAPENTLPAYQLAYDMGFTYVETDISMTSDGVFVLLHDIGVSRTSDGYGLISSMTLEEVKKLDFGSWKDPAYAGTTIPTLDEFLDLCKSLGLKPYLELKFTQPFTESQVRSIVDAVIEHDMLDDTTFVSMSYSYLKYVRDYEGHARLGYIPLLSLTSVHIDDALELRTGYNDVFIDTSDYSEQACTLCKGASIPMEIWTIDDPDVMSSLDPYITGVTSNSLKYSDYVQKYIISFVANGGSEIGDIIYTQNSERIVLPESVREGYVFDGWYDNQGLSGERIIAVESGSTGDMTLYAKWNPSTYTVVFVTNGGSELAAMTYTTDKGLILPETSRYGYSFIGWFDNPGLSGDPLITIEPGSVGDMVLYAKWTLTEYTIRYMVNGGQAMDDERYTIESERIVLKDATKDKCTFAGWYATQDFTGDKVEFIEHGSTGDVTVYAKWEQDGSLDNSTIVITCTVIVILAIVACAGIFIWKKR